MATEPKRLCPLPMPLMTVEEAKARRQAVLDFIERFLEVGVDYGSWKGATDPNASKEARKKWMLYKSGAQKLAEAFGLRSRNRVTFRDVTATRVLIECDCDVIDSTGEILATRSGMCSSDEDRFDYLRKGEAPRFGTVTHNVQAMAGKRAFVEALEAALALGSLFTEDDDVSGQQSEGVREQSSPRSTGQASGANLGLPGDKRVEAARQQLETSSAEQVHKCGDCPADAPDLTQAAYQYSTRNYGKPLCHNHQKDHPKIGAGAPAR